MKWDKYLGMGAGVVGICINYLWGGLDVMFAGLLGLMVLDFLSGIICGVKHRELNSQKAYAGITRKKMMILIMVTVSVIADMMVGVDGVARSATIFFYAFMEFMSLTENAGKIGLPLPPKLEAVFEQLRKSKE